MNFEPKFYKPCFWNLVEKNHGPRWHNTYVCNFFGAPCQHSSPTAYLNPPHASGQSRKVFVGAIHAILPIAYLEKQSKE